MQSVTKTIYFYDIIVNPTTAYNGLSPIPVEQQLYTIFLSAFPSKEDYYRIEYQNKTYILDVIHLDGDYMYASCSVKNNLSATSFLQARNNDTGETTPFTKIGNNMELEHYTLFIVDFKKNILAALYNKSVSKLPEILREFVYVETGNTGDIAIIAKHITDLHAETRRFNKEFKKLGVAYSLMPEEYTSKISNVLGSSATVGKFEYTIHFSSLKRDITDDLESIKKEDNRLSSLKLTGTNEEGVDEVIDFFERNFTRSIPIQLTEDADKNKALIKDKILVTIDSLF